MEKYYLKNGKEVNFGDTITVHEDREDPKFGKIHSSITVLVNDYTIDALIKEGYIVKKVDTPKLTLAIVLEEVAKKHKITQLDLNDALIKLTPINTASVFTFLLKAIAIELDKQYEDHISNSPRIFGVSLTDGKITEINKAHIRNYDNFAAFRTVEDAKIACKLLKNYFKIMYAKK